MGLFDILFGKSKNTSNINISLNFGGDDDFDSEEYARYNNEKINEFKSRYDLTTVEGIMSIPVSEAKKYPDGGKSVVYMPEQILNRQATEYKKENKFDLAIACLKKANEMYPYSFYPYQRDSYERLVDFMVLAKKYEDAKREHEFLNKTVGTRLDELRHLQQYAESSGTESKEDYYNRIIKLHIEEERQREEYYWLLENYPDIAPKSFGGYRRMKKMNSDTYKNVVEKLRENKVDIETVSFWK